MRFSYVAIFVPELGWRFLVWLTVWRAPSSASTGFPNLESPLPDDAVCLFVRPISTMNFRWNSCVRLTPRRGLRLAFEAMGAAPQPSKAFRPASNRHYLGTSIHGGDFCTSGTIRFQPKSSTRAKVIGHITQALACREMDRDTAGKLRGDLKTGCSATAPVTSAVSPVLSLPPCKRPRSQLWTTAHHRPACATPGRVCLWTTQAFACVCIQMPPSRMGMVPLCPLPRH